MSDQLQGKKIAILVANEGRVVEAGEQGDVILRPAGSGADVGPR
jgi:hypothetical protein